MEVWLKERVLQRYVIENCSQFKVNGLKAVRARDNKDRFPDVYFILENNDEVPVEVEWQTTNFIQHGHDLDYIKENNGCLIVCNQNLDLGKVHQIKIDITKFEDWFEKNAKRIIQDTTEPYKKKDKSRTNPKLWFTYISLKAGGASDFKKALCTYLGSSEKLFPSSDQSDYTNQRRRSDCFYWPREKFSRKSKPKTMDKKEFQRIF